MDDDGNVKNSTLVVGVAVALVLVGVGTLLAEVLPRFRSWAFVPALVFAVVYVNVHRSKSRSRRP